MSATVYLIHLDHPIHHAKHYLGYTALESIHDRFTRHLQSNGARLLARANALGIHYQIVRTWDCSTTKEAKLLERRLKGQHNAPKLCPICQGIAIFLPTENPPQGGISPDCNIPF